MRLIALYAMLAATSTLSLCERRNPEVCREGEPGLACPMGQICRADRCVDPDCADDTGCSEPGRPICKASACVACASDVECGKKSAATPYCRDSRCVPCAGAADCGDPLKPVCDTQSYTCRPCARHDECAAGVCAKDDLLASLPGPLAVQPGTCVPQERILTVDLNSCRPQAPCNPREAMDRVSPQQPYVRLRSGQGMSFTNIVVPGPNNMSNLKVVHLIGPTADVAPTRIDGPPQVKLGGPVSQALSIDPGYRVVVEGLWFDEGLSGIKCTGTGQAADTELRVERSVFTSIESAITVNECRLRVSESWIGAGFGLVFRGKLGNGLALKVVNSEFTIENSVLFRNGLFGAFGGIQLFYDPPWKGRSAIINSTLAFHSAPAGSGAVTLDCNGNVSERLTIFNSFLYNDLLTWQMQPTHHVAAACQPQLGAIATNDAALARDGAPGVLVTSDAAAGFRASAKDGDLHLQPEAPASVATGGAARFQRGAVDLPAPARDLEGATRGRRLSGQVSIGAFEVPGP